MPLRGSHMSSTSNDDKSFGSSNGMPYEEKDLNNNIISKDESHDNDDINAIDNDMEDGDDFTNTIKRLPNASKKRHLLSNINFISTILFVAIFMGILSTIAQKKYKLYTEFQRGEALHQAYLKEMKQAKEGFHPEAYEAHVDKLTTDFTELYSKLMDMNKTIHLLLPHAYPVDRQSIEAEVEEMQKDLQEDSNRMVHQLEYAVAVFQEMERLNLPKRAYSQTYIDVYSTILYRHIIPQRCAVMMTRLLHASSQALDSMRQHVYGTEFNPEQFNLYTFLNTLYAEHIDNKKIEKVVQDTEELNLAIKEYSTGLTKVAKELKAGFYASNKSRDNILKIIDAIPDVTLVSNAIRNYTDGVLVAYFHHGDSREINQKIRFVNILTKRIVDVQEFILNVDMQLRALVNLQDEFYKVHEYLFAQGERVRELIANSDEV